MVKYCIALATLISCSFSLTSEKTKVVIQTADEFKKNVKHYLKLHEAKLLANIGMQADKSCEPQCSKFEKRYLRFLGKRTTSQPLLNARIENYGIFQCLVDALLKKNIEFTPLQLELLSKADLAFQTTFNSTTAQEIKLEPLVRDKNKIPEAFDAARKFIKTNLALLKNKTQTSIPLISPELLQHARQISPVRKNSSRGNLNSPSDSPRISPIRKRSNTVAL